MASPSAPSARNVEANAKSSAKEFFEAHVEAAKKCDRVRGLTDAEALALREKWGWNELPETHVNPFLIFLSYFWGPMPCMIWVAIIIELVKAILTGEGWEDFSVLMVLQFANATVGFIEEHNAGNAIAALKNALKPLAYVNRNGTFESKPARELVPGDIILLKLGDVVPADSILLDGYGTVQVDQAALTGESLPVDKVAWQILLMGSAVKRGELRAMVADTGMNTFFGKAAGLIAQVTEQGHLQKVLLKITISLLVLSILLCSSIFAYLMAGLPDNPVIYITESTIPPTSPLPKSAGKVVGALSVVIVILVASIPIAIEVVCTATLAVGSHMMASKKVIVARLSAIEELAGMSILCSDKTGTLTLNKLSLREPIILVPGTTTEEMVFVASLASKHDKGSQDAIDQCITGQLSHEQLSLLHTFTEEHFEPFNPVDKRTFAQTVGPKGEYWEVSKGAPQVILKLAHNSAEIKAKADAAVQDLSDRGFRSLGVGINRAGRGAPPKWEYLGVLSLFDPPREDTKATIAAAIDFGIEVKMVTGDHGAIAKETCRELGMGTNILNTEVLNDKDVPEDVLNKIILEAHGFAEVMPEHKFEIVARLRTMGFVTGMTGDGVNDAPALKRADVGIAVDGATDAARAAADLVLTSPGLGVIIEAIFESRKIFQRMRNYIIYRIACTIQLLLFFFFAIFAVNPDQPFMYGLPTGIPCNPGEPSSDPSILPPADFDTVASDFKYSACHANAFTLPVIALVIITILNDGCMITISHDNVMPEKKPQTWDMVEVTVVAVLLGLIACISSLILLAYGMHANVTHPGDFFGIIFGRKGENFIRWYDLRTILYLKVSISDFLTLFSARTRTWFWERRVGKALGIAACVALMTSTLFSLFWDKIFAKLGGAYMGGLVNSNGAVISTWIYCILWFLVQDALKIGFYKAWDRYFALVDAAAAGPTIAMMIAGHESHSHTPVNNRSLNRHHLPDGIDLNAIAKFAATESIRVRDVAAKRAAATKGAFVPPVAERAPQTTPAPL